MPSFPVEIPTAFGPLAASPGGRAAVCRDAGIVAESITSGAAAVTSQTLQPARRAESAASDRQPSVRLGPAAAAVHDTPNRRRPAANGIFVEFNNQRWYSSAPPAALDLATLRRIGEWHGFPGLHVAANGELDHIHSDRTGERRRMPPTRTEVTLRSVQCSTVSVFNVQR